MDLNLERDYRQGLQNSILQKRDSLKGVAVYLNEKRMGVSSFSIMQDLTTEIRNKIKETNDNTKYLNATAQGMGRSGSF